MNVSAPLFQLFFLNEIDEKWYTLELPNPLKSLVPIFHNLKLKSGSDPRPGLNSSLKPFTLFHVLTGINDGCQWVPWKSSCSIFGKEINIQKKK